MYVRTVQRTMYAIDLEFRHLLCCLSNSYTYMSSNYSDRRLKAAACHDLKIGTIPRNTEAQLASFNAQA